MNESKTKYQHEGRQRSRMAPFQILRFAPLACMAVCLCSCTTAQTMPFGGPGMRDDIQYHHPDSEDRLPEKRQALDEVKLRRESQTADDAAKTRQTAPVQTASHSEPATIRVNDAGRMPVAFGDTNSPVRFTPAQPRVLTEKTAIQLAAHQQPGGLTDGVHQLAQQYPDEYLFDGGDRALPIHYDTFRRLGLDTEDTVAEYADHKGKRHVKASNRVAVYAPRFGAVRTISIPITGVAVRKATGAQLTTHGAGLLARSGTAMHVKGDQADGIRMRSRASGLNSRTTRLAVKQSTVLALHDKLLNLYENLSFVQTGRMNTTEEARLAARIQAAAVWSRDRFPQIVDGLDAINEVEATSSTKGLIGVDDSHKTDGRLRIVKLADKQSASPGDVITFTIRYDNLGDQPVKNIRIVDNLTTRLEYIDDSATSDRAGRLDIEDNEEGSLVLKFVLSKPLPGRTGGFVTFKTKVR